MTAPDTKAVLAYWLIPAESVRNLFVSMIAELAWRFDAPLFEPHVTVYAGTKRDEDQAEILSAALAGCEPFHLTVRDIQSSDEFTKTVFVQFEPNATLSRLSDVLQQASPRHHKYELNPHLSLIYKEMIPQARADVAASITLPFTEVTFDCAMAIVCPRSIRSREDVEPWRVVASQRLTK